MFYVSRDKSGKVNGIFHKESAKAKEALPENHPDIALFFGGMHSEKLIRHSFMDLTKSDLEFIRVIEDLVDLLIAKNILTFTELPEKVREKILSRKDARGNLSGCNDLVVSDKGVL